MLRLYPKGFWQLTCPKILKITVKSFYLNYPFIRQNCEKMNLNIFQPHAIIIKLPVRQCMIKSDLLWNIGYVKSYMGFLRRRDRSEKKVQIMSFGVGGGS